MQPTPFTPSNRRARRGNTIVLVTAILVLLVIIATAFVSRTRAVRQTSAAQQASAGRDGRAESVAMNVAQEIAGALFVKPIDTSDPFSRPDNSVTPPVVVASSSWPRLASPLDAPRYSVDPLDGNGDGFPELGYNFAPYEVKPWTNWPDFFGNSLWPFGPGAPGGQVTDAIGQPIGDGNPYGNPGFGDTRWLRSTEPQRYGFDQNGDGVPERFAFRPAYPPPSGTEPFVSSHWTHLSWLPSANNGWRVVADISDIELNTVTNLNEGAAAPYAVSVPYEQWLPGVFPAPIQNGGQFQNRVQQWFFNYPNAYLDPTVALPNFFHLRELGTPTEEFKLGSLRNVVSRTFTDADGDGFTDSFWFLAPIGTERSIRTLVGVSIVDNSALLNANIATKFSFETTAGATPADLGLVTSAREFLGNQTTTVGFFDGPVNQPSTDAFAIPASNQNNSPLPTYWPGTPQLGFVNGTPRYSRSRYGDAPPFTQPLSFLQSIGMRTPTGLSDRGSYRLGLPLLDETLPQPLPRATFESAAERLAWFKIVGDNPEQPRFGLTPFDAADEFELRAFHGNNMGGTLSRFEQAVSLFSPGLQGGEANDFQFLRSSVQREENDEYLDQLDGRELLVDNRRKLTMFSGARNEIMPPALWTTPLYDPDTNYLNLGAPVPPQSDPNINAFRAANFAEWERQKFKVDLREPTYVDQNGALTLQRNPAAAFRWRRDLQRLLENSLTSAYQPATGATVFSSYLDHPQVQPQNAYWRTRSMIASYVANLDCASDEAIPRTQTLGQFGAVVYADDDPLLPTIPPNQPGSYLPPLTQAVPDPDPQHPDRVYVGMEKQPFIQEVFFGIVYPRSDFSELRWNQEGQANGGCILPASAADIELPDEGDCQVLEGGESYVDLWQPSQTQPPEYPNSRKPRIVAAVQIANPYDTPISLRDFRLSFFDQEYSFAQSILDGYRPDLTLPAATLARPSTAIVYFAPESLADDPNFRQKFLDFIDAEKGEVSNPGGPLQQANLDQDTDDPQFIEFTGPYNSSGGDPLDRTVVLLARNWDVNLYAGFSTIQDFGRSLRDANSIVELRRVIGDPATASAPSTQRTVVVDRFENERVDVLNQSQGESEGELSLREAVDRLTEVNAGSLLVPPERLYANSQTRKSVAGIRLGRNDFYMTWARATRAWAFDVNGDGILSATELSPRYVFSYPSAARIPQDPDGTIDCRRTGTEEPPAQWRGERFSRDKDPDDNVDSGVNGGQWPRIELHDATNRLLEGKPVSFSNITLVDTAQTGPRIQITYQINGNPVPFVGDGLSAQGQISIAGLNYTWITGSKNLPADYIGGSNQVRSEWTQRFNLQRAPALHIPFQMTQKDSDFEQIGEVLDVFLWGHVLRWSGGAGGGLETVQTFSETLVETNPDAEFYPGVANALLNRLRIRLPGDDSLADGSYVDPGTPVLNGRFLPNSSTTPPESRVGHKPWQPALPMGIGFLDALTIDGPGRNSFDRNNNGAIEPFNETPPDEFAGLFTDSALAEQRCFRLSRGYEGKATPGLININTALPEVMQALPMLTRLKKTQQGSAPYSHFVDAIRSYRDRWNFRGTPLAGAPTPFDPDLAPTYADRGLTASQVTSAGIGAAFPANSPRFFPSMRTERGFASIGELLLLNRFPEAQVPDGLASSYSSRWLALDPYRDYAAGGFGDYTIGYSWSTDRTNPRARQLPSDLYAQVAPPTEPVPPVKAHDEPLGDAEDANLVFKGISNLITTRSDVFTVYLKIRQVKQNDVTGVWDGTNRESIVDEARYVMCVDRSNCDSPDDQPKIVYFQKCP